MMLLQHSYGYKERLKFYGLVNPLDRCFEKPTSTVSCVLLAGNGLHEQEAKLLAFSLVYAQENLHMKICPVLVLVSMLVFFFLPLNVGEEEGIQGGSESDGALFCPLSLFINPVWPTEFHEATV